LKKILIDTTAIPKKPVGAGVYLSRLVKEILICNTFYDVKILSHEDDYGLFNLPEDYIKYFLFQRDFGRGYRIISEQLYFPKLLADNQIDLFHGLHYSLPINKRTRMITTIHDLSFFKFPEKHSWVKRQYFKFFIKYSSFHSDHLITVSNNTKNDLIKILNVDPEKITTTHLGVDESFSPIDDHEKLQNIKAKYDLPENFILFIGLIEPRKNLSSLFKAYAKLVKTQEIMEDIHLVLAGRWGWESKKLLTLVSDLNVTENVHFPGYIDQEDMAYLYNLAKVFVYPSFYEGFGLPVLEAMACGTPVITSNISSMPEFVGNSGILVDPNDIDQLERSIKELLINERLREELKKKSILKAKEFTWKNTALKTLDVYQRVLNGE